MTLTMALTMALTIAPTTAPTTALRMALSKTSPAEEFHLFSFLPVELRLKIWRLAESNIPGRVIPLHCLKLAPNLPAIIKTSHPVPQNALAKACKESHLIVRRCSMPLFMPTELAGPHQHSKIFFNPEKDTLLIPLTWIMHDIIHLATLIDAQTRVQIRSLTKSCFEDEIATWYDGDISWDTNADLFPIFQAFPQLDVLYVALEHWDSREDRIWGLYGKRFPYDLTLRDMVHKWVVSADCLWNGMKGLRMAWAKYVENMKGEGKEVKSKFPKVKLVDVLE